jgi:hypothetical protein
MVMMVVLIPWAGVVVFLVSMTPASFTLTLAVTVFAFVVRGIIVFPMTAMAVVSFPVIIVPATIPISVTTILVSTASLSQNLCRWCICLDFFLAEYPQYDDKVISDLEPLLSNSQSLRVDHLAADFGPFCASGCFPGLLVFLMGSNAFTNSNWLLREADLGLLQDALEGLLVLLVTRRWHYTDLFVI